MSGMRDLGGIGVISIFIVVLECAALPETALGQTTPSNDQPKHLQNSRARGRGASPLDDLNLLRRQLTAAHAAQTLRPSSRQLVLIVGDKFTHRAVWMLSFPPGV